MFSLRLPAALPISLLLLSLSACSSANHSITALPTANIQLAPTAPLLVAMPTVPATALPTLIPSALPATPTPANEAEQYRTWMDEARAVHPYPESIEQMWAVMLCESGGQASISNGMNHGLFQYADATWAGDWNPYHNQPITDARAQIFATAKAWNEGHQHWWGCYSQV